MGMRLFGSAVAMIALWCVFFSRAVHANDAPWRTFHGKAGSAAYQFQETKPGHGVLTVATTDKLFWLYVFRGPVTSRKKIAQFHVCPFDRKSGACAGPWRWITPHLTAREGDPGELREARELLREAQRYVDAALKDVEKQKKRISGRGERKRE